MTPKKLFRLLPILFLLFAIRLSIASNYKITVINSDAHTFSARIQFDTPELVPEAGIVTAQYEKSGQIVSGNRAVLPVITRMINLSSDAPVQVNILSQKWQSIQVPGYLLAKTSPAAGIDVNEPVQVEYLGAYRSIPLFAIHIYPARYDANRKTLNYLTELSFSVTSSGKSKSDRIKSASAPKILDKIVTSNSSNVYRSQTERQTAQKADDSFNAANYSNVFKIAVQDEGIYKVTYDDLKEAEYPVDFINPINFRLINKGREVPLYIKGANDGRFDEGDYFEFWGEPNIDEIVEQYADMYKDPFSDENIYWLVTGSGLGARLVEESGIVGKSGGYVFSPQSFRDKIHFEEDNHFENFGHISSGVNQPAYEVEHWYYDRGISAPEGKAYDFYLPHPEESGLKGVVITAALRGKSYYSDPTNLLLGHEIDVKLRGKGDIAKLIGKVSLADHWKDQEMRIITNADSSKPIPQSVLINGTNRLEFDMFQTGVTDIVLMNWFEVEYQRKYRAYKNYLRFRVDRDFFDNPYVQPGDTIQINIDGFDSKDISVYKLGTSRIMNGKIGNAANSQYGPYAISIWEQVFDPNTEYVAITESAKLKPLRIEPYQAWQGQQISETLQNPGQGTDYLIITHKIFQENANRLKEIKNSQGFHASVVTVENIYDTFNFGIKSPIAIKEFIKYVYTKWPQNPALQYVVFVGKASYDYKGYIAKDADLVPTFMYQTLKYGAAASDYWYALLDDDYIPDVTVGRIPASTNEELLNYLDKIENYGSGAEANEEWASSALFISGNDAGSGDTEFLTNEPLFRAQNNRLLTKQLPGDHFISRLNTVKNEQIEGYDPDFGSTTDLIQYFDDGLSFINFLGHGGGGIWADVQLMNLADVERLNNGYKLPFIASMTCFTGAFENPNIAGLGERLILGAQKGAIAMLASSGVGWKYNDFAIEWNLFDYLWDPDLSMGQAVDLMKINYLANPVYSTEAGDFYTFGYSELKHSMVSQYNYLGDPSLKIIQPSAKLSVKLSNYSPLAGDSVTVFLDKAGFSSGTTHIQVCDANSDVLSEDYFAYTNGANYKFAVPEDQAGQQLTVKAFVGASNSSASGYAQLRVEAPFIKNITTEPASPTVLQPIRFEVHTASAIPINQMVLTNFRNNNTPYGSTTRLQMEAINDTLFRSVDTYEGFSSGGSKLFDVEIVDTTGGTTTYRRRSLNIVDNRPELKVIQGSLAYDGENNIQIRFEAQNESDSTLSGVLIYGYDQQGLVDGQPFAEDNISFAGSEQKTIRLDYPKSVPIGHQAFKVVLDPQNDLHEQNENNNSVYAQLETDHIFIAQNLGTSVSGLENDTVTVFNKWHFHATANALNKNAVVSFEPIPLGQFFKEEVQSGLKFVSMAGATDSSGLKIVLPEQAQINPGKMSLGIRIDTSRYSGEQIDKIALFKLDAYLNIWIRSANGMQQAEQLIFPIDQAGSYAIFMAEDNQKPSIEVTANGRPLIRDMLLTRKPLISLLLEDDNGVRFNSTLNVYVDDTPLILEGKPLLQQEVFVPDSTKNARAISITANPQLEPGSHTLLVEVADVNGNTASTEAEFTVAGDFFLELHGNYPNPFADRTNISYTLTNDIDDLSIKIYTLSGRLIRKTMLPFDESIGPDGDDYTRVDYHELVWDGTDDDGKQVANGVYFLVLKATYSGKTVTKTLKIARLQ